MSQKGLGLRFLCFLDSFLLNICALFQANDRVPDQRSRSWLTFFGTGLDEGE